MKTLLSYALSLCLAFTLVGCDAFGGDDEGDETEFQRFDENDDDAITADEFNRSFGDLSGFDDFDADESGDFDEGEFNESFFDAYDRDDDTVIDEDEFSAGDDSFFDGDSGTTLGDLDTDESGDIGRTEFEAGFGDTGLYDDYDANQDSVVDEGEINETSFEIFDDNDDNNISQNEFGELLTIYS